MQETQYLIVIGLLLGGVVACVHLVRLRREAGRKAAAEGWWWPNLLQREEEVRWSAAAK